ncbi:hypothetical protein CDAR_618371 [Caerostris darwini]|uniref:Uncharacterized protein n=1 Tax=Caerostris darwini TaxID=1538125 RepID=A0AAV4SZ40_9ARAC|nr:hypothetical protein CDAR_618371 [Caerostris darwini]
MAPCNEGVQPSLGAILEPQKPNLRKPAEKDGSGYKLEDGVYKLGCEGKVVGACRFRGGRLTGGRDLFLEYVDPSLLPASHAKQTICKKQFGRNSMTATPTFFDNPFTSYFSWHAEMGNRIKC